MTEVVGFVGLGGMGTGMATNLQKFLRSSTKPAEARSTLLIYNRTKSKADALESDPELQCKSAGSIAELAECAVVFCMLSNDEASRNVLNEFCNARKDNGPATVYVDCSTILPSTTVEMVKQGEQHNIVVVACPVFGRPDAAAAGRLLAVTSTSNQSARKKIQPYIHAFAARTIDLDGAVETANALKLAGNFWIVSQIEVISECLTLAEKNGVPRDKYLELLEFLYSGPIPMGYATRIAKDDFPSTNGFAVDLALKDVGHMKTIGSTSSCPVPLADLAYNHLVTAQAQGHGQRDWGAIAIAIRQAAGMNTGVEETQP